MHKYFSLIVTILIGFSSIAQTATIKGVVTDATTKLPIMAANVSIKGTTKGTYTDKDGKFELTNINSGMVSVRISFISYHTKDTIVSVSGGSTLNLNIELVSKSTQLRVAKVRGQLNKSTETAVTQEVKNASEVVNAIGEAETKKTTAGNAAQVAARIPGVTIFENSFVMIRGLSQRYNNVLINGISAPSTEPDSRSFSFDLIPSSVLERMLVYKSGAANLPGDFAGGVIKLYTKSMVEENFTELSFGLGFRINTTFKQVQQNSGTWKDALGTDGNTRTLPSFFPENLNDYNNKQSVELSKRLENNFNIGKITVMPDLKFGITMGNNLNLKKINKKFIGSTLNALTWSSSNQYTEVNRYRWSAKDSGTGVRPNQFEFKDYQYDKEYRIGFISNWSVRNDKKTSYNFRNTFNQIGERSTIVREGAMPQERPTDIFRNYSFQYLSRTVFVSQFEGNHLLNNSNTTINYIAGFGLVRRNEPDFMRLRTYTDQNTGDGKYTIIDPPNATTFDNARFFSLLNEKVYSQTTNLEHKLYAFDSDTSKFITIRAGYYAEYKDRSFDARWMSYVLPSTIDPVVKNELIHLNINEAFNPENLNATNGWILKEGTNLTDRYIANSKLGAGYLGFDIPIAQKWKLNTGGRLEYYTQKLESADNNGPIVVENTFITPMPFGNLSFNYSKKSLVRIAYSQTVNRPEFRELAPFLYYNFKYDANFSGNPNLKQAVIQNIDLRWETYPTRGETFSVGFFYKNFDKPIETYVQPIGLSQQYELQNADKATNFGAEIELRRQLLHRNDKNAVDKNQLTVVANAAYIYSQVDLGNNPNLAQDRKRALQGQSPYVVNMSLFYETNTKKDKDGKVIQHPYVFSLLYNVAGKRIFFVGNNVFPTVFEMPRHVVDLTLNHKVNEKISFKIAVSDILNYQYRLAQDSNRDGKIDVKSEVQALRQDDPIQLYRRGTGINFGLSIKI